MINPKHILLLLAAAAALGAQADIDKKQSAIDRKMYVDPAPKTFKPRGKGPLMEMTLTLEKSTVRKGAPIRYRLTITSVGTEPVLWGELTQSVFKTGRIPSDALTLAVKFPNGKTHNASSAYGSPSDVVMDEVKLPPGLSEAGKAAAFTKMRRERQASVTLLQKLEPGETLHTVGDENGDEFRTLNIDPQFAAGAEYELYFVYRAFSKYEKSSNRVKLKILP